MGLSLLQPWRGSSVLPSWCSRFQEQRVLSAGRGHLPFSMSNSRQKVPPPHAVPGQILSHQMTCQPGDNTCTYGLRGPIFDAAFLTASLSMSIWFARRGERLEEVLGPRTATATLQPRGALRHALPLPSAAEPCSPPKPPSSARGCPAAGVTPNLQHCPQDQMVCQHPGLHGHQWSKQEAGLVKSKGKEGRNVSRRCCLAHAWARRSGDGQQG